MVAEAALTPTEGPERWQRWLANKCVINSHNLIRIGSEHNSDVDASASGEGGQVDLRFIIVIVYEPVLGSSKIRVHAEPGHVRSLRHVEWVHVVCRGWGRGLSALIAVASRPQAVDAVSQKEALSGSVSEAHDTLEIVPVREHSGFHIEQVVVALDLV